MKVELKNLGERSIPYRERGLIVASRVSQILLAKVQSDWASAGSKIFNVHR